MDALSEVLRAMRLSGGVFLRATFTEPWCLASGVTARDCSRHLGPADHLLLYHYVLEGALSVTLAAGGSTTVRPGQAVIFPRNDQHRLHGREPAREVSALEVAQIPRPGDLMTIDQGGGGATTRIVCGFLGGPALAGDPLLTSLPPLLVYDGASARSGAVVRELLSYAADEVAADRQGSGAMLARLSELLFIEAVRAHVEALPPDAKGWLAALGDPRLARALGRLHAEPERPWTAAELGRQAGLSRSALAQRFGQVLGSTPAGYLSDLRLRLAARALAASDASILSIANEVGFGSEAAFSRAFKRGYGLPPSVWRRRLRDGS